MGVEEERKVEMEREMEVERETERSRCRWREDYGGIGENIYLCVLLIFWLSFCCCCCWVVWAVRMFWKLSPCRIIGKYFLPVHRLSFSSVHGFLWCTEACKFDKVTFIYFCFNFYCFGRPKETSVWFMSENVLPLFSSRSCMVSCLIFKLRTSF